jgi:hypothetical protein
MSYYPLHLPGMSEETQENSEYWQVQSITLHQPTATYKPMTMYQCFLSPISLKSTIRNYW